MDLVSGTSVANSDLTCLSGETSITDILTTLVVAFSSNAVHPPANSDHYPQYGTIENAPENREGTVNLHDVGNAPGKMHNGLVTIFSVVSYYPYQITDLLITVNTWHFKVPRK